MTLIFQIGTFNWYTCSIANWREVKSLVSQFQSRITIKSWKLFVETWVYKLMWHDIIIKSTVTHIFITEIQPEHY